MCHAVTIFLVQNLGCCLYKSTCTLISRSLTSIISFKLPISTCLQFVQNQSDLIKRFRNPWKRVAVVARDIIELSIVYTKKQVYLLKDGAIYLLALWNFILKQNRSIFKRIVALFWVQPIHGYDICNGIRVLGITEYYLIKMTNIKKLTFDMLFLRNLYGPQFLFRFPPTHLYTHTTHRRLNTHSNAYAFYCI